MTLVRSRSSTVVGPTAASTSRTLSGCTCRAFARHSSPSGTAVGGLGPADSFARRSDRGRSGGDRRLRFERLVAEGRGLVDIDPAAASLCSASRWRFGAGGRWRTSSTNRLRRLRSPVSRSSVWRRLKFASTRTSLAVCRRAGVRARVPRPSASAAGAPDGPTDGRPVSVGSSGRRAPRYQRAAEPARRGARTRTVGSASPASRSDRHRGRGAPARTRAGTVASSSGPGLAVRGYELREGLVRAAQWMAYGAFQPAVGREVTIKAIRPTWRTIPGFIRRFQSDAQSVADPRSSAHRASLRLLA